MSPSATYGKYQAGWRAGKWIIGVELLIVGFIFLADFLGWIRPTKTIYLLALGWLSLRVRGLRWRDVGLGLNEGWLRGLGLGLSAGVGLEAIELFLTQPFLVRVLGKQPDLELFRALHGNLKLTLLLIVLAWTIAAFGEEMVFRGYLMNRVADLFDRSRLGWVASLVGVHVLFGLAHAYQGVTGVIDEGLMGLLLGLLYLFCRRSLTAPIVAHGVADTIDMVLLYLGAYPGM
jgi:membrane protease YdiL (CAAX protease family)